MQLPLVDIREEAILALFTKNSRRFGIYHQYKDRKEVEVEDFFNWYYD